ncbi:NfeD family protein [Schaalia sp. Marseille-Q2122]|uniref:NfeD family protein n=1 Tax=Schaalia sp. Marseille-Q2122 TaxID=2736604 RepID=UPI00158BC8FA|nr:NfeD family protein [Schaalia sp. Marseille-Q2122]
MSWVWWVIAAVGLGIVELLTVDLIFLMLALAALCAALASALGAPLIVQVAVFAIAAMILLFLVRPWAKAHLARSTPNVQTNAQSLVGMNAVVTEPLEGDNGRVRLDGEIWSARAVNGALLPKGTAVTVKEIDGATAVVMPIAQPAAAPCEC